MFNEQYNQAMARLRYQKDQLLDEINQLNDLAEKKTHYNNLVAEINKLIEIRWTLEKALNIPVSTTRYVKEFNPVSEDLYFLYENKDK